MVDDETKRALKVNKMTIMQLIRELRADLEQCHQTARHNKEITANAIREKHEANIVSLRSRERSEKLQKEVDELKRQGTPAW